MAYKPSRKYDYLIKILMIGDTGVGKSSLLLSYTDDKFTPSFIPTIGIDFRIKIVEIDDVKYKLQIWDTAGQERFKSVTTAYYRNAMSILLVYDVSNLRSFHNINGWMQNVLMNASPDTNLMLIANKCDVEENDRAVTTDMGKALADHLDIKFMETSAKTHTNIKEVFTEAIKDVKKRLDIIDKTMNYTHISLSDSIALTTELKEAKKQNESKKCSC